MHRLHTTHGILIEARRYSARLIDGPPPCLIILREGVILLKLPIASGLARFGALCEELRDIRIESLDANEERVLIHAAAESADWAARRFEWVLSEDSVTFQHFANGSGRLGRCFFFSNGVSETWGSPGVPGVDYQTTIHAETVFAPRVNHGNAFYHSPTMPQNLGIHNEMPNAFFFERSMMGSYLPEQMTHLFCPPPLALVFGKGSAWASIGIAEKPGLYLFNALDYSGSRYAGGSFAVNYNGYRHLEGEFASPVAALHFGFSEFETLEQYIAWHDASGFSTTRPLANPAWHREPIFCGWAEQTWMSQRAGVGAGELCTQENYERWLVVLESRGIHPGTIVLDDKWQAGYGSFDVDTRKWPDLKGFIARQHAKGRHVLLWVPSHHTEGIPEEWCVQVNGMLAGADVTHPEYEAFLRGRIRELITDYGADGFKEDWLGGLTGEPDAVMHGALYGLEFLRRFQWILYDETHRCKPGALIETQTPHPLFRESSDVLRLNDIFYGTRGVTEMMRLRARIARIAGWPLVDCDNASATTLDEWWVYMQAQPSIGIPALYFVEKLESTFEEPTPVMWAGLAALWAQYRRDNGLEPSNPVSKE